MRPPKSFSFYDGTQFGIPGTMHDHHDNFTPLTQDCPKITEPVNPTTVQSCVSALLFAFKTTGVNNPCITASTAAAVLGLDSKTMSKLIVKGCLPTYLSGTKTLIRLHDLPELARKLAEQLHEISKTQPIHLQ